VYPLSSWHKIGYIEFLYRLFIIFWVFDRLQSIGSELMVNLGVPEDIKKFQISKFYKIFGGNFGNKIKAHFFKRSQERKRQSYDHNTPKATEYGVKS
jgi:hypothetical protein